MNKEDRPLAEDKLFIDLKKELYEATTDFEKSQIYLKLLYLIYENNKTSENCSTCLNQQLLMLLNELFMIKRPKMMDVLPAHELSLLFSTFHKNRLADNQRKRGK